MPWLLLGVVLFLVARSTTPGPAAPVPPAPGPPEPPAAPRPNRFHFQEVSPVPERMELAPGTTYLAQVDVPFLLGALVGGQQIREGLEREGFVVIRAQQERPDFWPSDDFADWYLVASYSGERRARNIPGGIVRLWQAIAAPSVS